MKKVRNKFGTGILYEADDLGQTIYAVCTACMSVWSDLLSYANYLNNFIEGAKIFPEYIDTFSRKTDTIVVLGCQVTDLAIYNDLKTAEKLHEKYPDVPIYMGGCLAQRFDIELPEYLRRLDVVRKVSQDLENLNLIDYRKPFWNQNLKDDADELEDGNLFRHMYPLKTGAGCHGKCKYCTIRDTRGETYYIDAYSQIKEFLDHADTGVVITSDSPTIAQIKDWCRIAERYTKPISFRNVEPQVANACIDELCSLAGKGLLKIFHCPIQSNNERVLKAMNRNVEETFRYIDFAQDLRKYGVIVATNIIIDYVVDGEMIHNMPEKWLNEHFDYWVWNPYFDGKWDYQKAKERFDCYILQKEL